MATYLHKFGVFYFDWLYILMWVWGWYFGLKAGRTRNTIWLHLGLGVPLVVGGIALVGKYYYHP
jgi:hypothetical protein